MSEIQAVSLDLCEYSDYTRIRTVKTAHSCFQIAPRGFEPLNENQQTTDHKTLTENQNPVLYTGLDKILQKYPELAQLVEVWPNLPEHIKAAMKALIQSHGG